MQFDFYTMVLYALALVFMALGISNFVEGQKKKEQGMAFFGMLYIVLALMMGAYGVTHM